MKDARARVGLAQSDWAHAPQPLTGTADPHLLDDHLQAVGDLAFRLAPGKLKRAAYLAGRWHDFGKRRLGFQSYIRNASGAEAHIEGRVPDREKTHSAAGALWAEKLLADDLGPRGRLISRAIQYVIAGHHAGLDNWFGGEAGGGLAARLASEDARREFDEARERSTPIDSPELTGGESELLELMSDERATLSPGRFALAVRMLFSALVDADFLDTEAYLDAARAELREGGAPLAELRAACDAHLGNLTRKAEDSSVNRARAAVLDACRRKSELPPGVFSLTVPTGGGKTLASLAFALHHAVLHGKERIVYAIPFTSIIEQTADVFRGVFSQLGPETVLEHHSNVESTPEHETPRSRLACENWDASLIVTTNVQLFESLFARRTSRCRKLHNLANSVIVLDEAQMLPVEYLQPIVDVLRYLVRDYGVTVLLCTATQPVLDRTPEAAAKRGLHRAIGQVTELVDDVPALYRALERVRVQMPESLDIPRSWEDLAEEVAVEPAVLAIVSRRADAAELYRLVRSHLTHDEAVRCWHLSGLMCPQHRSDVIVAVKNALAGRQREMRLHGRAESVRLISTQVVEAGVDIDFPIVYRALAGLDSLAQAAGRCNREGRLEGAGKFRVFVPPTEPPVGLLRQARDTCRAIWGDRPADPFALPLVSRYFERLYHDAASVDQKLICELLRLQVDRESLEVGLQFRDAAEEFRLIDNEDSAPVVVRYDSPSGGVDVASMLGVLSRDGPSRWLMRKLQRFTVTIPRYHLKRMMTAGDVIEIAACPGLFVQHAGVPMLYDPFLGLQVDAGPGDPAAYIC